MGSNRHINNRDPEGLIKTGPQPELMQDCSSALSIWFATRPGAGRSIGRPTTTPKKEAPWLNAPPNPANAAE